MKIFYSRNVEKCVCVSFSILYPETVLIETVLQIIVSQIIVSLLLCLISSFPSSEDENLGAPVELHYD